MDTRTIGDGKRSKWILVANRGGAKLFAGKGHLEEFHLVKAIPHPEGRRQNHEIDSDNQGSRFSSTGGRGNSSTHGVGHPSGQAKHGMDRHEEAIEHEANVFAKELCDVLYEGRTHGRFDELILVAEPQFLGRLRSSLDKETANKVLTSVNHNWIDLQEDVLRDKVRDVIRERLH